ncbi:hypothetical protein MAR_037261 [Mya arenaria]|uniref:ZP domain-containing protein n=1 Tax=Mya arenaria TaxID=6604 RepID=A0ABY7FRD1_MYAAR|nr:hypothetical protein MAR_037261 [Mya arenaria]
MVVVQWRHFRLQRNDIFFISLDMDRNVLLLLGLLVTLYGCEANPNDPSTLTGPTGDQFGDLRCPTDDNGMMVATFEIWRNNSATTRVYFSEPADPTVGSMGIPIDQSCCLWTGNGIPDDPFIFTAMVNTLTDTVPSGCDCGIKVLTANYMYQWTAYAQQVPNMNMEGDIELTITCNIDNGLLYTLQAQYTNVPFPIINIPAVTTASWELGLYRASAGTPEIGQGVSVAVGTEIKIRLTFDPPTFASLTNINEDETTGCSIQAELDSPFTGTRPSTGVTYQANTGNFEVFRFAGVPGDLGSVPNTLTIHCEAYLCWLPNDPNCIDRCAANQVRRKRQAEVERLDRPYVIQGVLTITDPVKTEKEQLEDESWSFETLMVPILSVVGVVLLVLVVAGVALCIRRRREPEFRKYSSYSESSSVQSHNNRHFPPSVEGYPRKY